MPDQRLLPPDPLDFIRRCVRAGNLLWTHHVNMRFGAYDDVRFVPASGYVGPQVGAIAMIGIARAAPEVPEINVFVRGGYYTSHVQRADEYTILGGIAIDYDLGAVR